MPVGVTPIRPTLPTPRPVRVEAARAVPVAPAVPAPTSSYLPEMLQFESVGELVGTLVVLPATAVLFVAKTTLLLGKLTAYQLFHPFNGDVARCIGWVRRGCTGEPPTHDASLLDLIIRTQNAPFADLMAGYMDAHPKAEADVVAVMRWAIATQGKGAPPTRDPHLLGALIRTQNAAFADLMTGYVDRYPARGPDVAGVLHWAIRTRGKGVPPTHDPRLLGTLIRTQNAAFADLMAKHMQAHPSSGPEVAKVMRWAIETHGKGVPPTNDPRLLATLIRTQRPDFADLMARVLRDHPEAAADIAQVQRWAIKTGGKGLPPSNDPFVLAALIGTVNPAFGKLMATYATQQPQARPEVVAVEKWAIGTKGQGVPPTHDPKLLGTLIESQDPGFGRRMLDHLASNPTAGKDVAAVARWAIETRGKGRPPTDDPKLLASLIAHVQPTGAAVFMGHLAKCPDAGSELAKVMHWAIATHGQGKPPTDDPRLLATLIGHIEPVLGARLDRYAVTHPKNRKDLAAVAHWIIATKGQVFAMPPTRKLGLLFLLARFGLARKFFPPKA